MRIGVVGRGGTGRTTVAALVSQAYVERGNRVVAIDTDPIPNLGMSLGLDAQAVASVRLVPRGMAAGIGARLTPSELVAEYGLATPAGVTLLNAMRAERDGQRCFCLGHINLRSSLAGVSDDEADVTVIDVEAGLEHLTAVAGPSLMSIVSLSFPSRAASPCWRLLGRWNWPRDWGSRVFPPSATRPGCPRTTSSLRRPQWSTGSPSRA